MDNIVKLLEQMGEQGLSFDLSDPQLNTLVNDSSLSQEAKNAIIKSDVEALNKMLDTREKIVAFLIPAEEEEDEGNDEKEQEEETKKEAQLDRAVSSL